MQADLVIQSWDAKQVKVILLILNTAHKPEKIPVFVDLYRVLVLQGGSTEKSDLLVISKLLELRF